MVPLATAVEGGMSLPRQKEKKSLPYPSVPQLRKHFWGKGNRIGFVSNRLSSKSQRLYDLIHYGASQEAPFCFRFKYRKVCYTILR